MMTDREKRVWTLVGKLALVAIPAAISGVSSYAKARVEATAQSNAAYVTLKEAVEKLQQENAHLSLQVQGLRDEMVAKTEPVAVATSTMSGTPAKPTLGTHRVVPRLGRDAGTVVVATLPPPADAGVVSAHPVFVGKVKVEVDDSPPDGDGLPDTLEQAVQLVQMRAKK